MRIVWDREANAAYISLVDRAEQGAAHTSVSLNSVDGSEVEALRWLTLDFDIGGRLVGIEVFSPESVLRESTLQAAKRPGRY